MTLNDVQKIVRDAGYRVSAACHEDERVVYACSIECHGPATFAHPRFAVQYHKGMGRLTIAGSPKTA